MFAVLCVTVYTSIRFAGFGDEDANMDAPEVAGNVDGVTPPRAKTTIQLQPSLRRWFKAYAATQDVTLYDLINRILSAFAKERGYTGEPGTLIIQENPDESDS